MPPKNPENTGSEMASSTRDSVNLPMEPGSMILPEPDNHYLISEDRLETLQKAGKSTSLEWAMGAYGVSLGLLPNTLQFVGNLYSDKLGEETVVNVVCALVFAAALVYGISRHREHSRSAIDIDTLVAKIRSGKKVRLE